MTTTGTLAGRVGVITGSGKGIGRALAVAFAREGATVVLSSRTRPDLEETLALVRRAGAAGSIVVADAATADGAATPVHAAIDEYGRLDLLVNNVGGRVAGDHDPFSGDVEVFHAELVLNLMSAWWATRAALPHMKENRYGRVVNIGSGASRRSASCNRTSWERWRCCSLRRPAPRPSRVRSSQWTRGTRSRTRRPARPSRSR